MSMSNALNSMLLGVPFVTRSQVEGPQVGTVLSVDEASNTAYVTLDESTFGTDNRFGPMPYGRNSELPQVGDKALVVFVNNDIDRGWLVSWQEA